MTEPRGVWPKTLQVMEGGEAAVVVAVIVGMLLLLTPLPGVVVDGLLGLSLAGSLALLLRGVLQREEVRPRRLPAWLLLSSLARIFIALGAARSLLGGHAPGPLLAGLSGQMSEQGASPVAGVALLAMLAIVNYVVLGLGVMRLAEVAARFALDALPGRQMALENALNAGRAEPSQSALQEAALQADSAFFGAMDGVSRFLRGEVVASLLICALIPLGALGSGSEVGTLVGVAVGLGGLLLVSALISGTAAALSLSAGTAEHRDGGRSETPAALVLGGVALALAVLALAPGLLPLAVVAVAVGAGGAWLWLRQKSTEQKDADARIGRALGLGLGLGLVPLLTAGDLPRLLSALRGQLADELGFALPPFEVVDEASLPTDEFVVTLEGTVIGSGRVRVGRRLVVVAGEGVLPADGIETALPDGTPCTWLRAGEERQLPLQGYYVLEPIEALLAYIEGILYAQATELLDRQRAVEYLQAVAATHPTVTEALARSGRTETELMSVGRALLREGIPLRERVSLVEGLAGAAAGAKPVELVETTREALVRTITGLVAPEGVAEVIVLTEGVEAPLRTAAKMAMGEVVVLPPETAQAWYRTLNNLAGRFSRPRRPATLLCEAETRPVIAQLISDSGARLRAVSARELQPLTRLQILLTLERVDEGQLAREVS